MLSRVRIFGFDGFFRALARRLRMGSCWLVVGEFDVMEEVALVLTVTRCFLLNFIHESILSLPGVPSLSDAST